MLSYYELDDKYDTIREWYDGYRSGNADVYCPWDVINYVHKLQVRRTLPPQDFWINTSSNDVIRKFLERASAEAWRAGGKPTQPGDPKQGNSRYFYDADPGMDAK